ncbi:LysR family transcriptional regulator ArgP [Comamonas thiooxydans]|uniref:LysR family transcriptional regulator ArgP n=1 Tax=Comamonas thiooxydans TaxID=363952 RepID=UPI0001BB0EA6|nr:LysR family transcriptional regulator ArgP [Comamonas thiooxydans]ACY30822.1 transcriptional regulator, LysR family [Comamonas thiooxydans]MDO1472144.1 LysR family transcriptional regulator ArgP [Comamonas thiooxydans]BDB67662.1 chromosome replication initiation inhibitor [Comamonas thiooxydans]
MSSWDPVALECLAAIVEEGGFERAAQRLHITQSAVSQRLRALEAQVGSVLVERTRPVKPTSAGRLLLKHAKQLRLLRADLAHELQELAPQTGQSLAGEIVSIAINADSIATWAMTALDELVKSGLPLEVVVDDQDFTQELLRSGQVMGCVTTLSQALRGCTVQPLGAMRYVAVASREFAQQRLPQGLTRKNFNQLPYLSFNRKDDMQAEFVARCLGLRNVSLQHQILLPSCEAQVRAVRAGWGVGVLPQLLVQPALDAGELIDVATGHALSIALFWHCWNLESRVLARVSQALLGKARQVLQAV